jgi:predicted nucleic acid-binding protein
MTVQAPWRSRKAAEKPAIIFVCPKTKQARQKGPPLLPDSAAPPIPEAVIDTNVLLDWLVFADPSVAPLTAAVQAGRLRWVATEAMLDELFHVLSRPALQPRAPAASADAAATIAAWCHRVPSPAMSVAGGLVCTDGDDQMFIDLALQRGARWLVSRDRALLALGRRALARGTTICLPQHWVDA